MIKSNQKLNYDQPIYYITLIYSMKINVVLQEVQLVVVQVVLKKFKDFIWLVWMLQKKKRSKNQYMYIIIQMKKSEH